MSACNTPTEDKESNSVTDLYNRYCKRMVLMAYNILEDPYEAEDAVHDAFVSITRNSERILQLDESAQVAYMIKSARNSAYNIIRKKAKQGDLLIDMSSAIDEETSCNRFWQELDIHNNFDQVVNAILNLNPIYRDVMKLYYLREMTVDEISKALERKADTIRQQLVRGRNILIRNIQKEEGTYDERKEPKVRRHRYSKKGRS